MTIHFNTIIPNPMQNDSFTNESIWGKEWTWKSPQIVIFNAVSGKGKSSFVDFLTGVRLDYQGEILFDLKSIKDLKMDDWSEIRTRKLAVVYQDLQLFEDLSVIENVLIKNELTNHFTQKKIELYIEKVGLKNQIHQACKTLSFGQKQRVAILRALAQPFKLLILDEPFSHLDKANETILLKLIESELKENNAGLILTTLGEIPNIRFDKEVEL